MDLLAQAIPEQAPWWLREGLTLISLIGALVAGARWIGPRLDRVIDANVEILETHAKMLPKVVELLEKHDITLDALTESVSEIDQKLEKRLNRHSERLDRVESTRNNPAHA